MTRARRRLRSRPWACAVAAAAGALARTAHGQAIDVERAYALVVGAPPGARADRVDAGRTGYARTPLPASGLRVAWRNSAGGALDGPPLVDARGTTYVVAAHGEVVAIGEDGAERWRAPTGGLEPGPPALLADDTLVFVDASGAATAVRDGSVRWRTRVGPADAEPLAPLPLGNGGVVVGTAQGLVQLDADGHARARVELPEPCAGPLVAALGRVVAVAESGVVWGWTPGAPEAVRLGSFGSSPDTGAALASDRTLVAVVGDQTTLAALDLVRGTSTTRAVATGGQEWFGPPAMRGEVATLVLQGPAGELAVTLDGAGRELSRALLVARAAPGRVDAGAAPAPGGAGGGMAKRPLLVDAAGTVAFGTLDGGLGVVPLGSADPAVEVLAEACPGVGSLAAAPTGVPRVAGLAPLAAGSFVATCRSGAVVAVTGRAAPPAGGPADAPRPAR